MNLHRDADGASIESSTHESKRATPSAELVSIGLPVCNGGQTLRGALDSILCQDHTNLEIIVSDNCSTDETGAIALEYQRCDPRIIYHRQVEFITALENFRFVLDRAKGDYFMWAAHDDSRSADYVSGLLHAMRLDPEPILTFGDYCPVDSMDEPDRITLYDFENITLNPLQRLRKAVTPVCAHIYGLWRTNILRSIRFYPCALGPDQPIMAAAAYRGTFKYVPGPMFKYLVVAKSPEERAAYQDGKLGFNRYLGMLEHLFATYKTCAGVGGVLIGMVAGIFVVDMHARNLPGFISRRWQRIKS